MKKQNFLKATKKHFPRILLLVVLFWIIISFLYTPVLSIFQKVFFPQGGFSTEVIRKLAASERVVRSLRNSFVMAFLTILTVNIVGIFQIAVTEFFEVKFARVLRLAFFTPLLYGSVALVSGYKFVYGSSGALTQVLTNLFPTLDPYWFTGGVAILFVHTFSMTIFHIIFVRNSIKHNIDNATIEAARTLGANNFQIFLRIALPIIRPTLYAATLMVFLMALGSHAAPTILGGREFQMINSMIQSLNSIGRIDMAALLALMLGLASFVLLTIFRSIEKRGHYVSLNTAPSVFRKIKIRSTTANIITHISAYVLFIIYAAPVVFIIVFSFAPSKSIFSEIWPSQLTFMNYINVLTNPVYVKPLLMSLLLASLSTVIAIFISLVAVIFIRKSGPRLSYILEFSMFIPWILPASMLAIGLISAYSVPHILLANNVLLGSFWILPIGYSVYRFPLAVRMLNAAFYGINTDLENAARSLGAKTLHIYLKVIIPLLMPAVFSIGALTFNSLLAEYTLSALLYNINNKPLGVAIQEGVMTYRPESAARTLIYVVIIMFFSLITILITNRLNEKKLRDRNTGGQNVLNDNLV